MMAARERRKTTKIKQKDSAAVRVTVDSSQTRSSFAIIIPTILYRLFLYPSFPSGCGFVFVQFGCRTASAAPSFLLPLSLSPFPSMAFVGAPGELAAEARGAAAAAPQPVGIELLSNPAFDFDNCQRSEQSRENLQPARLVCARTAAHAQERMACMHGGRRRAALCGVGALAVLLCVRGES
jgi:hypothetical protein